MMKYTRDLLIPTIFPDRIEAGFGTKLFSMSSHPGEAISLEQVHGEVIVEIDTIDQRDEDLPPGDALISSLNNLALVVKSADCVPILYYDETADLIAASHQGWQGNLKNLPKKVIQKMCTRSANIDTIKVAIGPCIGPCCYKLQGSRLTLFKNSFPDYYDAIILSYYDETRLCLSALSYLLLIEAGVLPENIEHSIACTSCNSSLFNSYNKDKATSSMESFIRKLN